MCLARCTGELHPGPSGWTNLNSEVLDFLTFRRAEAAARNRFPTLASPSTDHSPLQRPLQPITPTPAPPSTDHSPLQHPLQPITPPYIPATSTIVSTRFSASSKLVSNAYAVSKAVSTFTPVSTACRRIKNPSRLLSYP